MNIRTGIFISFQKEGFHCWKKAPEEVFFLRDRHRHMFHVEIEKVVNHSDRDIEIILFKREVMNFMKKEWGSLQGDWLEFGTMSCEMIAQRLLENFDCKKVKVTEDGENGAVVWK